MISKKYDCAKVFADCKTLFQKNAVKAAKNRLSKLTERLEQFSKHRR